MKSSAVLIAAVLSVASVLAPARAQTPAQAPAAAPAPHDIEDFIRKDKFQTLKISPTGEYFAATVPVERKTMLVILRRSDNKLMASTAIPGDYTQILDFWWVSDERVVFSGAEKIGALERPQPTGELYAINFDGSRGDLLVGQRVRGEGLGTRVQKKKVEAVAAYLVDDLTGDDKNVIIAVRPFSYDPYTRVERMNVYTGQRIGISVAPVRNADFLTDHAGNVRLAMGEDVDLSTRTYHRKASGGDWVLINDTHVSGVSKTPLGFSADDKLVYLLVEHDKGPNSIDAWDPQTGESHEVFRDDDTDPDPLYLGRELVGVEVMDGLPRKEFFDPDSKYALLYRKLERAFPQQNVTVTSITSDGGQALVYAESDRTPGDFYVFDAKTNRAEYVLSRQDWVDPKRTVKVAPVDFASRDGKRIHGYLASPAVKASGKPPLIVFVHGGPFGVRDVWGFDRDVQMLAAYGYAVLQVNFRGSGGYGRDFQEAGRRQWGGTMQDDLTDATRWAIAQGIADPDRICIYGASYGAYAALMGAVKEPTLYRCAVGYVGVYDLPTLHTDGDTQESTSGKNFVDEWIGPRDTVAKVSPTRLADRIKVPVLLAAGGEDERAPIQHTQMMEKALRAAGVPVEAHYYPTEGHGFYKVENARDYYTSLLAFFHKHLGGREPAAAAKQD